MGNLEEDQDVRMARKMYKQPIFTKIRDIFTTPVSFAHIAAMSRPEVETQWSETETETETRLWSHETEALKNVS